MTLNTTRTDSTADTTEPDRPTIVKNAASSYFSAVDLQSGEVRAQVGDGRYPHTAVFHPTKEIAYLVYISSAHIEVLDTGTLETVQRIEDLGVAPVGSALSADASHFFIGTAAQLPDDEPPGVMAFTIDENGHLEKAGERPISRCAGMQIAADGLLYVALKREQEVVALTPDGSLAEQARYAVGTKPHDMYPLDDGLLVVNNAHESYASVIDTDAGEVVAEPRTGENPHGFGVADGPDYRYGLFPAREDERVAVVDLDAAAAGNAEPTEAMIDVGTTTGFVGTTPDGKYAIVDSYDDTHVTILDLEEFEVVGRVEVGGEPLHVVFGPDGEECYVGNMETSELAVLDTSPLAEDRPEDVTVARRISGLGEKPSGIFRPEVNL